MTSHDQVLPPITIIPAGAGSGKTYTVQQRLGEWVEKGLIEPERIVAVTFTEAAAAELRERIRARLLESNRLEDALKLDQAYISTIHGFGLKILTEFSFEGGSSPQPRLLNEDEQTALIKQTLSHATSAKMITRDLASFGYKYVYNSGSAEDLFREDVLAIITLLRSIGWQKKEDDYAKHATDWIKEGYGSTVKADTITEQLHRSVVALLEAYPLSLADECGTSATAKNAFKSNFRDLNTALDKGLLENDWALWQRLRGLRVSMRGSPVPEEYEALAQQVMDAANQLPFHPGPLLHATHHIDVLIETGQDVLLHYSEAKREAGLVDYTDMIAMAQSLLSKNPKVLSTLVERIDCLVVDEFQDTNPLQFSLLWMLKVAGVPTLIVGDLKQAIMGFQGADARLFSALESQFSESSSPLTHNWRSQPKLMNFVNAIGPVLFGEAYTELTPKGSESELEPLEVIDFYEKPRSGHHMVRAGHVGVRLKQLLESDDQFIVDRRTKKKRLLQGGDIAVLAPTKDILKQYADVLRALGLKVRLHEDGWVASREIQIALHALSYVANPTDKHAALYLSVTELGQLSLEEGLSQIITNGKIDDALLTKLDELASNVVERTIYALVTDTLHHLNIFDVVSQWPDAAQARANLLRLQAEAAEYMDANREALANGGFYGSGIQSFLAWLSSKMEDNDRQPDPKVLDEDAVELVTWHSSKGREWPVVVVAEMGRKISASLPNMDIGYQCFDNLSNLLTETQIEYSPKFSATESNDNFLESLQINAYKEARRLLYVALTRARDKLILEWPSYLKNKPGTCWSILREDDLVELEEDKIKVGGERFDCIVRKGNKLLPNEIDLDALEPVMALSTIGRRAIIPNELSQELTPDSVSPSMLKNIKEVEDNQSSLRTERYGEKIDIESELPANVLGTLVHRVFEVIGSRSDLVDDTRLTLKESLDDNTVDNVIEQVNKFESWVQTNFSPDEIYRELPFISIDDKGSVVNGTIDLVIKNKEGIVIIDHKTDKVDDSVLSFENYKNQLKMYSEALEKEMGRVVSVGIHWIRKGEVVLT